MRCISNAVLRGLLGVLCFCKVIKYTIYHVFIRHSKNGMLKIPLQLQAVERLHQDQPPKLR